MDRVKRGVGKFTRAPRWSTANSPCEAELMCTLRSDRRTPASARQIHPTALVDAGAELADDVEVGPYAVIGPDVRIGAGTVRRRARHVDGPHDDRPWQPLLSVLLDRWRSAGQEVRRRTDASSRSATATRSASSCTFNSGTAQDGGVTRLGDDNWIMAYVHIAHDCASATTPSWPTTRLWPATSRSATGSSWAGCRRPPVLLRSARMP